MTVLFHKSSQHSEKVMNISAKKIIVLRKFIADRKVDRHSFSISLNTNKTITLTVLIDMAHLTQGDVTPCHVFINIR